MTDKLIARIERLEMQNRRMKMAISALSLCLGALLVMAHTFPQSAEDSMQRLEVREIALSDGTMSAKLTPRSLVFSAKSESGAERAAITASAISLGGRYVTEIKPTGLICSREGVPRFDLSIGEIGAALEFMNASGNMGTMLDETTMVLKNQDGILSMRPEHIFLQKGEADALLDAGSLRIRDAEKRQVKNGVKFKAGVAVPE